MDSLGVIVIQNLQLGNNDSVMGRNIMKKKNQRVNDIKLEG